MTKAVVINPYPFGSAMPTRGWSDANRQYRYGFNGKEKDFETANDDYDFGARIYDGRLGRWLSLDPLMKKYCGISPYNFCIDNPILYIDSDGKEVVETKNFQGSKYSVVFEELLTSNENFYKIASKFNSKNNKLVLDISSIEVPSGYDAYTYYYFWPSNVKSFFGPNPFKNTPIRVEANIVFTPTGDANINDLGRTILIAHELLHANCGLNAIAGDDVTHENWDNYFTKMQGIVMEYNFDNGLELTSTQVYELSLFNCGRGTKIFDDYISQLAKTNGTTIEEENTALVNRMKLLTFNDASEDSNPLDKEENSPSEEEVEPKEEDSSDNKK